MQPALSMGKCMCATSNMSPHAKTFLTSRRFETDSCSLAVHQPFEQLDLSVKKKLSIVRIARPIRPNIFFSRSAVHGIRFERLVYPFLIRSLAMHSAVWTDTVRNVFAWEVTYGFGFASLWQRKCASFVSQSQREVKLNQGNTNITFNTKLKTTVM